MNPTPFYGARPKETQRADFAIKQTNRGVYVALAAT